MEQRQNRLKNGFFSNPFFTIVKKVIVETPFIGNITKYIGKKIQWCIFKIHIKYKNNKIGLLADQIYLIDPNEIIFCTPLEVHPFKNIGEIIGGDWDKSTIKFENLDIFQAMKKRYFENEEWKNTEFYKNTLKKINNGDVLWKCHSEKDLIIRLKDVDQLFKNIKKYGYKSQLDLNKGKLKYCLEDIDEISVNIDRCGNMLFNNSAHRLAIAKLLNIKKVPVIITIRHSCFFNKIK